MKSSFVNNCEIITKPESEGMFRVEDGQVFATLDGYAIMPTEVLRVLERLSNRTASDIAWEMHKAARA